MCHFEDSGLEAGVDTKGTMVVSRDHLAFFEDIVEIPPAITIGRTGRGVRECIQRIVVHGLLSAFFLTYEPVHALLCAVGELIPHPHTGVVEVAEFIARLEESPHVREGITFRKSGI